MQHPKMVWIIWREWEEIRRQGGYTNELMLCLRGKPVKWLNTILEYLRDRRDGV